MIFLPSFTHSALSLVSIWARGTQASCIEIPLARTVSAQGENRQEAEGLTAPQVSSYAAAGCVEAKSA